LEFLGLAFYEIRDFIRWKGSSVSVNNLVVVIVGVSSNWSFFLDIVLSVYLMPPRQRKSQNESSFRGARFAHGSHQDHCVCE
jgi:hypothetical protein